MNDSPPDQSDIDMDRLKQAARQLGEHFDTVQIFCTRHDDGDKNTISANWGTGNWFARFGQVGEWLVKEKESAREERRQDSR